MPDLKWKNRIMLVFSLIFYAWAGPAYLLLLVGMTFADWVVAKEMAKCWEEKPRKRWLVVGCVINLGLLCFFKYLTFFLQNFHNLFGVPETVIAITLPIGISFYTFQLLSYMVDVYRQDVEPQQNFFTLLLYVSMFHQCIAGPIVRYEHVERELTHRKILRADVAYGIRRFTVGLAKRLCWPTPAAALPTPSWPPPLQIPFPPPWWASPPCQCGWGCWLTPCRSIWTSPLTRTWPSVWAA